MSLDNFGESIIEKERQNFLSDEKELFCNTILGLEDFFQRDEILMGGFGIDLEQYLEPIKVIITNLFLIKYGAVKTDIILWYLFDRVESNGKTAPLVLINEEDDEDEDEELDIETPTELFEFITKLKEDGTN